MSIYPGYSAICYFI